MVGGSGLPLPEPTGRKWEVHIGRDRRMVVPMEAFQYFKSGVRFVESLRESDVEGLPPFRVFTIFNCFSEPVPKKSSDFVSYPRSKRRILVPRSICTTFQTVALGRAVLIEMRRPDFFLINPLCPPIKRTNLKTGKEVYY